MISMRSSRPLASKPHDNTGEREQNPHNAHYNGLIISPMPAVNRLHYLILNPVACGFVTS